MTLPPCNQPWCSGIFENDKYHIDTCTGSVGISYKDDRYFAFMYDEGELPIWDRRIADLVQDSQCE